MKLSVAISASLILIVPSVSLGCAREERKTRSDEVQIAQAWLEQLRNQETDISETLSFMSSEFNSDGKVLTKPNDIRQELLKMRRVLSGPTITMENFQRLDEKQINEFLTDSEHSRSKHARKYLKSKTKIKSMVLFHLIATFPPSDEKNIDGVFLGFDSDKKIVSWFD